MSSYKKKRLRHITATRETKESARCIQSDPKKEATIKQRNDASYYVATDLQGVMRVYHVRAHHIAMSPMLRGTTRKEKTGMTVSPHRHITDDICV